MSQGERHTLVEVCRLIDRDTGPVFTFYQIDTKTCLDRQSFSSICQFRSTSKPCTFAFGQRDEAPTEAQREHVASRRENMDTPRRELACSPCVPSPHPVVLNSGPSYCEATQHHQIALTDQVNNLICV